MLRILVAEVGLIPLLWQRFGVEVCGFDSSMMMIEKAEINAENANKVNKFFITLLCKAFQKRLTQKYDFYLLAW